MNTAWAVLTLMTAGYPDKEVIRRGCQLIMSRQLHDGSWAQEGIEGVFNKNCAIVSASVVVPVCRELTPYHLIAELSQFQVLVDYLGLG